ncbi:hypothetical protein AVEN_32530-1, partial [Araneus ventricosus]
MAAPSRSLHQETTVVHSSDGAVSDRCIREISCEGKKGRVKGRFIRFTLLYDEKSAQHPCVRYKENIGETFPDI